MNHSPYSGRNIDFGRACAEAYATEPAPKPEQLYRITLIDGTTIDNLTYDEVTKYFYSHASSKASPCCISHAGSAVEPWPVTEYRAP